MPDTSQRFSHVAEEMKCSPPSSRVYDMAGDPLDFTRIISEVRAGLPQQIPTLPPSPTHTEAPLPLLCLHPARGHVEVHYNQPAHLVVPLPPLARWPTHRLGHTVHAPCWSLRPTETSLPVLEVLTDRVHTEPWATCWEQWSAICPWGRGGCQVQALPLRIFRYPKSILQTSMVIWLSCLQKVIQVGVSNY